MLSCFIARELFWYSLLYCNVLPCIPFTEIASLTVILWLTIAYLFTILSVLSIHSENAHGCLPDHLAELQSQAKTPAIESLISSSPYMQACTMKANNPNRVTRFVNTHYKCIISLILKWWSLSTLSQTTFTNTFYTWVHLQRYHFLCYKKSLYIPLSHHFFSSEEWTSLLLHKKTMQLQ